MNTIRHIVADDLKRITGNIVSIIIVIGLTAIPGLFTWFNVAASWNPFGNTGNLTFAVASVDEGYQSDLIPVKITIGDQAINALRANSQLDWTFTSKQDAIEGTKSGKYYAAVVIPKNFSKTMLTFFSDGGHHAKLEYYTNEKKNALAPIVTNEGADEIAAQINQTFAQTITSTAFSVADALAKQLTTPQAQQQLTAFNTGVASFAKQLTDTSTALGAYRGLTTAADSLLTSTNTLLGNTADATGGAGAQLSQAGKAVTNITDALHTSANTLGKALAASVNGYDALAGDVDEVYANAGKQAADTAAALRKQAKTLDSQAQQLQSVRDSLAALQQLLPSATQPVITPILNQLDTVIALHGNARDKLNQAADTLQQDTQEAVATRQEVADLIAQAKQGMSAISADFAGTVKPELNNIAGAIADTTNTLNAGAGELEDAIGALADTSSDAHTQLDKVRDVIDTTSKQLEDAANSLTTFSQTLGNVLSTGNIEEVRKAIGNDPASRAATLAAPVKLTRKAVYPVAQFGSAMTPFYTFLPLWVGALLMAVTLVTHMSRRRQAELGNPKPYQLFLGHYVVFALIALMQSTFSLGGSLLFLHVQAVHPLLFMLSGWVSSLIFSLLIYTLVVSFGNIGKALGVLMLIVQISGANGAYPLQMLPGFISNISPFLPITHSVTAMRAAIAGIYMNDYWHALGALLLFVPPILLVGLVLRKPLIRFNNWYIAKVESTRVF